ncbi:MAG: metallophosphoesterase [Bdellovibrionales bacterium]|nr:metallophosphoesterase [Bdellovibrionales bacterium]
MGNARSARELVWALGMMMAMGIGLGAQAGQDEAPLRWTLIHTNDLHSHLRPERDELGRGGIARLKTAADRVRAEGLPTLFVDGGDWSEGQVYYNLTTGRDTLNLMGEIGYDVAVVGNHDWYNGPDTLLEAVESAERRPLLVGANADASHYAQAEKFRKLIPPYVVRRVGGLRVALIGLLTYQKIYDSYLEPVKVTEPFLAARRLAKQLREAGADVVIGLSHNGIAADRQVLRVARELDFIVGAHDHRTLHVPERVSRIGAPDAWIVEAGSWGRYLGRMDLSFDRATGRVGLLDYRLIPMDSRIPEDPAILSRVEGLERQLESIHGPIFSDHAGESRVHLHRDGPEAPMSNFAADAILEASGADLVLENTAFIYGPLHRGALRTADVMNALPAIYNPHTGKTWTIFRLPLLGRQLKRLLALLLSTDAVASMGVLNGSGIEVLFDPLMMSRTLAESAPGMSWLGSDERGILKSVRVQGRPLEDSDTVTLAATGGVLKSIEFLNRVVPGTPVPLDLLVDTGIEGWRAVASHLERHSPIQEAHAGPARFQPWEADPALSVNDLSWSPSSVSSQAASAEIRVRVRNLGATPAPPERLALEILSNEHLADTGPEPLYVALAEALAIPEIPPQGSVELSWPRVRIPGERGLYPLTARLKRVVSGPNASGYNDIATRYFHP